MSGIILGFALGLVTFYFFILLNKHLKERKENQFYELVVKLSDRFSTYDRLTFSNNLFNSEINSLKDKVRQIEAKLAQKETKGNKK